MTLTNLNTDIWVVLLYAAVMVAALTLTAVCFYVWKQRPEQKDLLQEKKLHERLAEITSPSGLHARKPA